MTEEKVMYILNATKSDLSAEIESILSTNTDDQIVSNSRLKYAVTSYLRKSTSIRLPNCGCRSKWLPLIRQVREMFK